MLRNQIVKSIRLGDRGVNFWDALSLMGEGEAVLTQNCYWRHGLVMKKGSVKHSTTEVVASKPIVGLHRFYYDTTGKVLLATCGTLTKKMNDGTGAWTDVGAPAATDSTPTYFTTWGALNKCYAGNGVQAPFIVTNAEVYAAFAAAPATSLMFLPYRDRLLSIDTATSDLRWSGSYDDTTWTTTAQAIKIPGAGKPTALALHSLDNTDTGINAMALVTKQTSLYLFSGTDLNPAAGTYNGRLDPIGGGETVGCDAPRTIINTPKGTIFLGTDHQVYLLPFGSTKIEPIGHHLIRQDPTTSTFLGLESMTTANSPKACAAYHDGFYKLSFATSGTANNVQYWLDVNRLGMNEGGHATPWYGPMVGMTISMFALQNGVGDTNKLLGGNSGNLGFVYFLNDAGTYTDNGTAITERFISRHEPNSGVDVRVMKTEIEMIDPDNTVALSFLDTVGQVSNTNQMPPGSSGSYFSEIYFGEAYFTSGDALVRRTTEHYEHYIVGRMLATSIVYTSSTDRIELQRIEHLAKPFRQIFQLRA